MSEQTVLVPRSFGGGGGSGGRDKKRGGNFPVATTLIERRFIITCYFGTGRVRLLWPG